MMLASGAGSVATRRHVDASPEAQAAACEGG
jgi:hypothetical protein